MKILAQVLLIIAIIPIYLLESDALQFKIPTKYLDNPPQISFRGRIEDAEASQIGKPDKQESQYLPTVSSAPTMITSTYAARPRGQISTTTVRPFHGQIARPTIMNGEDDLATSTSSW